MMIPILYFLTVISSQHPTTTCGRAKVWIVTGPTVMIDIGPISLPSNGRARYYEGRPWYEYSFGVFLTMCTMDNHLRALSISSRGIRTSLIPEHY